MKKVLRLLLPLLILSCQNQKPTADLVRHSQTVNKGLEKLINDKLTELSVAASETDNFKQPKQDAFFYYKNTSKLLDQENHESDSLIFWRLTKSAQAKKYNFQSDLDSMLIFAQDTSIRKLTLLLNLSEYLNHIHQNYSYNPVIPGAISVVDATDSNTIHIYGTPHRSSELHRLVRFSQERTPVKTDTIPLWGTLLLKN